MKRDEFFAIYTLEEMKTHAEYGDAEAQANLGVCYELGVGVRKDIKQAVKWYKRSAAQDHPGSLNNLACCYDAGNGVSRDKEMATILWRKAAELGDDSALINLGEWIEISPVPKSFKTKKQLKLDYELEVCINNEFTIIESPTYEALEKAIEDIGLTEHDFVILTPIKPIKGSVFLQCCGYSSVDKNGKKSTCYRIETRFERNEIWKQFGKDTKSKNIILKIFKEYLLDQKLPDINKWKNISGTLALEFFKKEMNEEVAYMTEVEINKLQPAKKVIGM